VAREEPEKIRKWREEQKERLEEKGLSYVRSYYKLYRATRATSVFYFNCSLQQAILSIVRNYNQDFPMMSIKQ
jgi:hypothetical protein